VVNLLTNAVKFTPVGGRVDVDARVVGEEVIVSVRDTGVGIAASDQERIFEAFQRGDRRASVEGTGLGLTLSKRFVELHGGRMWVQSALGSGSTFGFAIPVGSSR
jgi:signal transduction histidine kinase